MFTCGYLKYISLLILVNVGQILRTESAPVLATNRRVPVEGVSFSITCTLDAAITSTATFVKGPKSIQGGCTSPSSCGSSVSGYSVSLDTTSRILTLDITSLNSTRDSGTWRCEYNNIASNNITLSQFAAVLDWSSVTFSQQLTSLPSSVTPQNTISVTVTTPCAAPVAVITWRYQQGVSGVPPSSTSSSQGSCPSGQVQTTNTLSLPGNTASLYNRQVSLTVSVEHDSFHPPTYTKSVTSNTIQFPVPVTSVTLTNINSDNEKIGQTVGQSLTLTCVTSASFPTSSVTWVTLPSGTTPTVSTETTSGVLVNTTSSVTFTVSKTDQGRSIHCQAENINGQTSPQSSRATLEVCYGPGTSVSITPSSPHTVVEGTGPLSIMCSADCNPTCGLRLRKGNTDVGQGQVTLDKVNRTKAGDYTCVAANVIGNVTKLFTLVVYYLDSPRLAVSKPQVVENATVSLVCSVSSSPTSQMNIRHVDIDTVLLTEVTNLGQYLIQRVQCLHNGTYQCSADNIQITGTKTTSASLDVLCSPRQDYRRNLTLTLARNINETASMVVDVIANPLPNFTWWRSSVDQLEPINKSTVHTVSSTDLQTMLQINVTQTRDYGKYALKMENSQGSREIVFTLTGKSRPYPPSLLGVLAGQTAAALSWISNFNGGAPQTYFLEYRSLASSWRNSSESGIPDPGRNRLVTYNITGLAPSTFYEFRLYSWNTYGTSDVLMINTTSINVAAMGPGFPVAAVVGGISAALLVIIIVAAVVLLYKRGVCASKEKRSGDVALFENDQRDREKPEMYANDLYATSGLSQATRKKPGMEDNVLYVGSGDVKGAASDGDVYAVVKQQQKDVKPKKGKDVPKKQHKGKGKGKNSDGQKTRRNQQSRGDVYENTVPGEFADGNTFANAGFEGDESTSGAAYDEKPSYGRNEDGLLYVGIDFGSHTPSQTMNRSEESTEYAGIAFGRVGPQPPQDEEEQK